ncbi:MAG: cytidine deaminase [Gammaproteobacteria bacterium]|nr:cytidine deaminase [Gammaproteobacteria bacterium]NNK97780.1 cytidine deaminase [Xanthomonadales bacterium]
MIDYDKVIAELFPRARAASENAYAPFSGARVGASVVDQSGNVYTGCNVENSSYGLTQCAERNALATAISAGMKPGGAHVLLVYATGFEVLAPCGACRQVMSELLADDAVVISCHSETEFRSWSMKELLPNPFVLS